MFILKKILSQFMSPTSLILWFSLAGLLFLWVTRRQRLGKVLVSIGLFLMLAFGYGLVPGRLLRPLERRYPSYEVQGPSASEESVEFIVVLGGGHMSDPELPVTSQAHVATLVRVMEAVRIYRSSPGTRLILSGGEVFDPIPEAEVMAHIARELGVDAEDILLEDRSKDTKDEARLIQPIVQDARFVLVTSASHMPRAMAMFRTLGMHPLPGPVGHRVKRGQGLRPSAFFPHASNLLKSEMAFHEYMGIVWAKLRGQV